MLHSKPKNFELKIEISEIKWEESRRKLMIPDSKSAQSEGSALATHYSGNPQGYGYTKSGKARPQCTHCSKLGHTKETCWQLHGKPADWTAANKKLPTESLITAPAPIPPLAKISASILTVNFQLDGLCLCPIGRLALSPIFLP